MNKMFTKIMAGLLIVSAFALAVVVPTSTSYAACEYLTLSCGTESAAPSNTPTKLVGDGGIFTTISNILIFLVGVIAVIMLIIGGIRYALSGGDQAAVTSAKNTILYAIIGLVVAFMAFAIINFVTTRLQQGTQSYVSSRNVG